VVGSAIIKHAFAFARSRPGGGNLGLQRLNVSLWWQGRGGMLIKQLRQQIRTMLKYEDPPAFLVLHISGNDIGDSKVGFFRNEIKDTIRWIMKVLPGTVLVWSQILPRLTWRFSSDNAAMNRCKYRINNSISAFILKQGGCYIRHPDIVPSSRLLRDDGVHLTDLGSEIFLNNLQGGLEWFIYNHSRLH
jgi:lysophospholipase L1-like esterase